MIPLTELLGTTTDEFYGPGSGLHYAMARYLCLYLQEQGLLFKYYAEFVEHHEEDPTGQATLERMLGTDDLDGAFQDKWQTFVLKLKFPP